MAATGLEHMAPYYRIRGRIQITGLPHTAVRNVDAASLRCGELVQSWELGTFQDRMPDSLSGMSGLTPPYVNLID